MLVVSVVVPAALVAVSAAVYAWHVSEREAARDLLGRAQILAAAVARDIDVSRATLQTLATSPFFETGDLARLHQQIGLLPLRSGARITLSAPDGQMLLTSLLPYGSALPRRPDAAALRRVFSTGQPGVSELYESQIPGERLVALDVPVNAGGVVAYDLEMAMSPSVLAGMLDGLTPPDAVATIVDGNGLIVARSPMMDRYVGLRAHDGLLTARTQAAEGVYRGPSMEGHPMLAAFAHVSGTGWSVLAATRFDLMTDALTRSLAFTLGAALSLLSLGLLFASYHARRIAVPLHALAKAARALASHEPPGCIPAGVTEISQVAAALTRASTALRAREQERDEAEAARRREQARLGRLLAMTPAGVIEFDAQGCIRYANPAAEAMLGADQAAILGSRFDQPGWSVTTPGGQPVPAGRRLTGRALAGESVLGCEIALDGLDGRRRMLLIDIVPVHDDATEGSAGAGGPVRGALAAVQDVTARHAAAQALRNSEARFRTMADAVPQVVWSALPNGFVDYCNQRYYEYTGAAPGGPVGDSWQALFHPDDLPSMLPGWVRSLRDGTPYTYESRLRRADGAWRWCLGRAVPMRDETTGAVLRWFGTTMDIQAIVEARETLARGRAELERLVTERTTALTEAIAALQREARQRQDAEAALRQAHKMEALGQLTGGIAHDFNNMLQAIGGNLDMLRPGPDAAGGEDAVRYVDGAIRMVERAGGLTQRLLAFARQQALQPECVPVKPMIEAMAELIQRIVGPAVQVALDVPDAACAILCDPNQLESALLNLAVNARDAMPRGGRLTISGGRAGAIEGGAAGQDVAPPGQYVRIAVTDTGEGMDEATRARAIEPFFTTKPMGQGTGLGLSQIHGFVRQSGGVMRLDSATGGGTTVTLYFPHQVAMAAAARPAESPSARRSGSLLIVEDEGGIRSVAAERLRALGYAVREAANAADGMAALADGAQFDLLLTDLGLPGPVNGLQLAEQARARWPDLPVLFITGYAGGLAQGELPPGMDVLNKPFRLAALAGRIGAMLDAAA